MDYINVVPANETVRKLVKHPSGVGFHDNPAGTAWPDDSFTHRRIADGDVVVIPDSGGARGTITADATVIPAAPRRPRG